MDAKARAAGIELAILSGCTSGVAAQGKLEALFASYLEQ